MFRDDYFDTAEPALISLICCSLRNLLRFKKKLTFEVAGDFELQCFVKRIYGRKFNEICGKKILNIKK